MELKFYVCKHCGNIVVYAENRGVPLMCCGERMSELVPNTTEAAVEKHLPVIDVKGDSVTVSVGSVDHPMTAEHYIKWVILTTDKGNQRKFLNPDDAPVAVFKLLEGETVKAAVAYCNLHGLWKTEA